ncbi:MAG: serine acetyltransferase [Cyclobacteriaceae bacterium]|nr:serine acetyltransferase [Cyclobacteriaceae bacterium]
MQKSFLEHLYNKHKECSICPSQEFVGNFFANLLQIFFPEYATKNYDGFSNFLSEVDRLKNDLLQVLLLPTNRTKQEANQIMNSFFDALPEVHGKLEQDVTAMYEGDPAAINVSEVIHSYPGFYAIAAYRFAHELHKLGVEIIPRMITEHAHSKTGIDIHPAAQIGNYFCIDHGTGIVIGETTNIGNHVKIYQGVTLGALSVDKKDAKKKRHPTIEDYVVIYSSATILGGNTVVGHHSVVGGNVWITKSMKPHSKVYYKNNGNESNVVTFDASNHKSVS